MTALRVPNPNLRLAGPLLALLLPLCAGCPFVVGQHEKVDAAALPALTDSGAADAASTDHERPDGLTPDRAASDRAELSDAPIGNDALLDGGQGDATVPDGPAADAAHGDASPSDAAALDGAAQDRDRTDVVQVDGAQLDSAPADAAQADAAQADAGQADSALPDAAQSDAAQPDAAQPDTAQPDGFSGDASQCGTCVEPTPYCDPVSDSCVECLQVEHCDDGNDCTDDQCDGNSCSNPALEGTPCGASVRCSNYIWGIHGGDCYAFSDQWVQGECAPDGTCDETDIHLRCGSLPRVDRVPRCDTECFLESTPLTGCVQFARVSDLIRSDYCYLDQPSPLCDMRQCVNDYSQHNAYIGVRDCSSQGSCTYYDRQINCGNYLCVDGPPPYCPVDCDSDNDCVEGGGEPKPAFCKLPEGICCDCLDPGDPPAECGCPP